MPPVQPPFKNDGPACRVCGCTEHNACVEAGENLAANQNVAMSVRMPALRPARLLTCHWIELPAVDSFKPLCSACAGSTDDAMEVIGRLNRMMSTKGFRIDDGRAVAAAFLRRLKARREIERDQQKGG